MAGLLLWKTIIDAFGPVALAVLASGLCLVALYTPRATSLAAISRLLVIELWYSIGAIARAGLERVLAKHVFRDKGCWLSPEMIRRCSAVLSQGLAKHCRLTKKTAVYEAALYEALRTGDFNNPTNWAEALMTSDCHRRCPAKSRSRSELFSSFKQVRQEIKPVGKEYSSQQLRGCF